MTLIIISTAHLYISPLLKYTALSKWPHTMGIYNGPSEYIEKYYELQHFIG